MLLFGLAPQVSVDILLQKAETMFPEGIGAPKAFVRDGSAAVLTNGLLETGHDAIVKLWKRRGYDPKKPDVIKARLGYALDKYEATARLVLGAAHLPALLPSEAWTIGKRIVNIVGNSGSIGSQLKVLRKRGKVTAPQVTALLRAKAALNLDPPPRADPPPDPSPEPTPTPPAPEATPPPLPPPTAPIFDNGDRARYKHPYTRPCPCGRGALAKWPWVVQQDHLGFCDCWMASWEIQCWRSEWIKAGPRR